MGVLSGLRVLDLSWGITGPITGMLLADHGASVTKIEPPSGDPWRTLPGYKVWSRGKRSAFLDLKSDQDKRRFLALVSAADVLIESFSPGTTGRLGIDYDTVRELNPRLIYCSITGYGSTGPDSERPGLDALVAARTGQQWEVRGTVGGTIGRLSGTEGMLPGVEAPAGCWVGPDRDGPLFTGVPWPSLATAYIATIGINAALYARQATGRGQHIDAALLHGVLVTTIGGWQKVDKPESPYFETWIIDPRAPKGFFRGSDGRWMHHWVPLPEFILNADANGMQATPDVSSPKDASLRVSPMAEDMILLHAFQDELAEAVGRHSAAEWTELAGKVGVPVQTVRSPEEALLDPLLLADGCVTEVEDPELGVIRQVGRVVDLGRHPQPPPRPAAAPGAHTAEVAAEADALLTEGSHAADAPAAGGRKLAAPLEGVTVLDLGLAVAGPFGTQVLAELGARVIKVNTLTDKFWFSNHIAMCCNRDKESIALNLKDPAAMEVLRRLVAEADVVQHNMRYDAAERLGVDYETLRTINPSLVYCHTLGHEQGPRQQHPGNDQTGAALAGTTWLDGGLDNDGRPIWSVTSLGDTGNGFLSALGIIQALYDRDRTGEGQFVRTSILYAHMLNTSTTWITPDGSRRADRQEPDAEQYGWNALYRLYRTSDGKWLCIAVLTDDAWAALVKSIDRADLAADPRFATAASRSANDGALAAELTSVFGAGPASGWQQRLDDAGVPAELSDPDYVLRLFADPEAARRQLVASFPHRVVGNMTLAGLYFDLSDTPGVIQGPPVWPGENTRSIMRELGYSDDAIDQLIASGAADDTAEVTASAT